MLPLKTQFPYNIYGLTQLQDFILHPISGGTSAASSLPSWLLVLVTFLKLPGPAWSSASLRPLLPALLYHHPSPFTSRDLLPHPSPTRASFLLPASCSDQIPGLQLLGSASLVISPIPEAVNHCLCPGRVRPVSPVLTFFNAPIFCSNK